jgi:hypothetical protein
MSDTYETVSSSIVIFRAALVQRRLSIVESFPIESQLIDSFPFFLRAGYQNPQQIRHGLDP